MDTKKKLTAAEKAKLYRQRNPERWNASLRAYWKKPKTCECGAVITNKMYPVHKRSAKHITTMKIKEYEEIIEKMKLHEQQPNVELQKDHGFDILNKA